MAHTRRGIGGLRGGFQQQQPQQMQSSMGAGGAGWDLARAQQAQMQLQPQQMQQQGFNPYVARPLSGQAQMGYAAPRPMGLQQVLGQMQQPQQMQQAGLQQAFGQQQQQYGQISGGMGGLQARQQAQQLAGAYGQPQQMGQQAMQLGSAGGGMAIPQRVLDARRRDPSGLLDRQLQMKRALALQGTDPVMSGYDGGSRPYGGGPGFAKPLSPPPSAPSQAGGGAGGPPTSWKMSIEPMAHGGMIPDY